MLKNILKSILQTAIYTEVKSIAVITYNELMVEVE